MCCTRGWAIRSTAHVRCCAGWWPPDISAERQGAASTSTREAPGGGGNRSEDCQLPERGADVHLEGVQRQRVPSFRWQKNVPARDDPAMAERPERFDAERRTAIDAEPIKK